MPLSNFRRTARRIARRTQSLGTIIRLTLSGNNVDKSAKLKNSKDPVLLIYGFGATRRTMAILEKRLRNDSYTVFSLNLGGFLDTFNTHSIEYLANLINEKVEKLYKKYKFKGKLSIVAHSKGGLIGHYYVKKLNGGKRAKVFVTLGTPHNGNPWAMLASYTPLTWILKSLKQMSPKSSFIQDLKNTPFPENLKVYSIYSKDDSVCPFPVPVLEESPMVKNIEVFGVTHSDFLIKKNCYYAIKHALKDEMPVSWEEASRKDYLEHLEKKKQKFKVIPGLKKAQTS